MNKSIIICVITIATLAAGSVPLKAETLSETPSSSTEESSPETLMIEVTPPVTLNRAKNYARQMAERANGGLSQYRAESSMHGPATESPYVDNGDGTWTFTFRGGPPGSAVDTVESVVTVDSNNNTVTLEYNGSIRSQATP